MTTHRQVTVYCSSLDKIVEVDEGLVDLLTTLWDQGFITLYSCQGGHDRTFDAPLAGGSNATVVMATDEKAYILFAEQEDADDFCKLAKPYVPSDLWRWDCDYSAFEPQPRVAVRFPAEHIDPVTRGLLGIDTPA